MKIKTKVMPYEKVMELPKEKAHRPIKPNIFFRTLIRVLSIPDLCKTHFKYTTERMDEIGDSPCLILMNHSSFIDLKIAYKIFYPKPLWYVLPILAIGFYKAIHCTAKPRNRY